MDRSTIRLKDAIIAVFEEYVEERKNSVNGLEYQIIEDDKHGRYQLVLLGWHGKERIHHLLFHLDIIDDKIWIQEDNTEVGIADLLTEKGVSKQQIVLAYFSEFHRQFTEFAVA